MASLSDYANAVPSNAIAAFRLGFDSTHPRSPERDLDAIRTNFHGMVGAIETAGTIGRRLLTVLTCTDGSLSREQLDFQVAGADPAAIDATIDRLTAAGLVVRDIKGGVRLSQRASDTIATPLTSLADQQAITSDELQQICRNIGVHAGNRKTERIAAIRSAFRDPASARVIREQLSDRARALLDRIADVAGPGATDAASVGLDEYQVMRARSSLGLSRYRQQPVESEPERKALIDLITNGIVGSVDWGDDLWIWAEAWPMVGRPFFTEWPTVPVPTRVAVTPATPRTPTIVSVLDRALTSWKASPPAALKNNDSRIAKNAARAAAKELGVDGNDVDLAARLAIAVGLLLRVNTATTGRGRNRNIVWNWVHDDDFVAAWNQAPPLARWLRIVAAWCRPGSDVAPAELMTRQLVMWELAKHGTDSGAADHAQFAAWLADRYATTVDRTAAIAALDDLRSLGIVTASDPMALTTIGAAVLEDPDSVLSLDLGSASSVIVQADLTIVAPPDLDHDLANRLLTIAELESESGAAIYRLDEKRITRAVQADDDADSILTFLSDLSSVPLADTVARLVYDAASRAGRVRVIDAPTVVVVNDAADLAVACSIKAAKLTRVGENVAVSTLTAAKVRTALDKKGLAPELIVGTGTAAAATTTSAAARAAQEAARIRSVAGNSTVYQRHAEVLEARAVALGDVGARIAVSGPLALTPALMRKLGRSGTKRPTS